MIGTGTTANKFQILRGNSRLVSQISGSRPPRSRRGAPFPAWYTPRVRSVTLLIALACLITACQETPRLKDWRVDAGGDAPLTDLRPPFTFPEAGDLRQGDSAPLTNQRCLGAKALTFTAGKATVSGTTAGADNEFSDGIRCGEASGFGGPQRYHKLALSSGRTYRLELTPQFDAVLYLFSDCSQNLINADCSSGGATGLFSGAVSKGSTSRMLFTAPATGSYRLAVDSASSAQAGAFALTVTELASPTHRTCLAAKPLTLSGGKATVNGTTIAAANENSTLVGCGLGVSFDGPQVYYSVALTKGSHYRLSLSPKAHAAGLYLFNKQGACKYANINADCGGLTGTVLPLVSQGSTGVSAFSPVQSGTYILAVDALDPKAWGDFSLTVESFTPAAGAACAQAKLLTLAAGKASASGSTSAMANDLGAHVRCGSTPPLLGPQAYYQVALEQKTYQLALKASFGAVLAVAKSCLTLPADCGSSGLSGARLKVLAGVQGSLQFTPPTAGTYLVVVDSTSTAAHGSYDLLVQEYVKPTHGACAKPRTLTLPAASPLTELGHTGPLANDLIGVTCGLSASAWSGPQAYYKLALKGGTSYTVTLTPQATFDPALYAFAASTGCTAAAVNAACKGQASDVVGAGKAETLKLSPAKDSEVVLVVDSWSPSEVGGFTLQVAW